MIQNRLAIANQQALTSIENIASAESGIRDVDVANESSNLVRQNILQKAGAAVLAQANQQPALALSLI